MSIVRTGQGFVRSVVVAILVVMVLPPFRPVGGAIAAEGEVEMSAATEQIYLMMGRSTIIRTDRPIIRVSLSTAEIADAMVTAPRELLVHGKTPGTISLLVWNDLGRITSYEIAVRRDLSPLEGQIRKQFPEESITVASNGKDVVLSGVVSTKYVIDRAKMLAVGYVDKADNVVSLLRQQDSIAPNQVMLNVRFAEVNRTALQELGANLFGGPTGADGWMGRSSTEQYSAPTYNADKGFWENAHLNLFAFNVKEQLGVTIKALKGKGLFESLAEPNLITMDGKEASFLAGGEYPYPVVQGGAGTQSVTIVFKEYGIRLRFTPTLTGGDFIHLKVAPEVSSLDFANAVVLEGFRVPALATRRTDTEVELHDGQTFAISGLLDRNMNETLRRVPGIGDIPILGHLFRSQAYQKNNTELVVMITPHIIRRDSPGVTPNLPGLVEPFLPPPSKTRPMPPATYGVGASQPQPMQPSRSVVMAEPTSSPMSSAPASNTVTSLPANTWTAPAATVPEPTFAPSTSAGEAATRPWTNDGERKATDKAIKDLAKRQALLAQKQQRQDAITQRVEAQQARQNQERARAVAKIQAEKDAKQRVIDAERERQEQKVAQKRAAEQAVIDRKRFLEQQEQAAEARVAADKIAKEQEKTRKEQDKLAKEQAAREAELARLVSQYRKLTEGQTQPSPSTQPAR